MVIWFRTNTLQVLCVWNSASLWRHTTMHEPTCKPQWFPTVFLSHSFPLSMLYFLYSLLFLSSKNELERRSPLLPNVLCLRFFNEHHSTRACARVPKHRHSCFMEIQYNTIQYNTIQLRTRPTTITPHAKHVCVRVWSAESVWKSSDKFIYIYTHTVKHNVFILC